MPARKLAFTLSARSGWEDGYAGSDISIHGPFMKGWRSQRFCMYPQELILQLHGGMCHVRQLQLLSHQYLIGHVSLSTNEKSTFRQRELKSIHLDVHCSELRLLLYHNHVNQLNLFNQVGIVAVNVIGNHLDDKTDALQNVLNSYSYPTREEKVSQYDDLAFAINQEPSTAALMMHLEKAKLTAIAGERYKLAKQLKDCIIELQHVGEVLASYEVQKREAIQREDYDTAEERRTQSETFRQQAYQRLNLSSLLEQVTGNASQLTQVIVGPQSVPANETAKEVQPIRTKETAVVVTYTHDHSHYDNQDNRPLPALVASSNSEEQATRPSTPPDTPTLPSGPEELSKKTAQEAVPIIEAFGMHTAELVYSKYFQYRSEGLDHVNSAMIACSPQLLKGVTLVLQRLLKDKVFQVFKGAATLLVELCSGKLQLSKNDITVLMEKVGRVLLRRLGDNTPRVRQAASETLQTLTKLPLIKKWQLVDSLLLQPPKLQSPWRQTLGQIEILQTCFEANKSTLPLAVKLLVQCMDHIQQPVRSAASDGLLQLYKVHGNTIRHMLAPQEGLQTALTWRRLFESFDRVDGKPTAADIAVVRRQQEKEEQEELKQLREQHKKLKALTRTQSSHDMCLFCGLQQNMTMEEHYLHCAMLAYCSYCGQMVEVSGLTDHWLTECQHSTQFHKCSRCGEAVHSSSHDDHQSCHLLENDKQSCPLCHVQIMASEQAWRDHLMGEGDHRCKGNTKPKYSTHNDTVHTPES
ncbi:centrosomal protein of 104 kDa-like isoform X2 [Dysidea avara]|uniref:centrosomal protein of 104 kDa-like isoform X2 n=1 Tax=Dysidea avara TaxID=196820 RepID=UPI00332D86F7